MTPKWIARCVHSWPSARSSGGRTRARVAYRVNHDSVAAEVASFSDATLKYWHAALGEISANPFPRIGYYVERVIPIPPLPMRTYLYWISEETSVSGERFFVFTSEFFPQFAPLYVVNETDGEVGIFYLRPVP